MIIILSVILIALSYIVAIHRSEMLFPSMARGHRANSKSSEHSKRVRVLPGLKDCDPWWFEGTSLMENSYACEESKYINPHVDPDMEIQYDLVLGDAILLLCFGLTWSDSWHPISESLTNSPPCIFFRFAIKPQDFFHMELHTPTSLISAVLVRIKLQKKRPAGTNITQIVNYPRTPIIPKVPSYSWTLGGLLPSCFWGPQWKQDFGCEPWFVLGLVWGTCQSDSIAKLDFSPFPKVPPLKFMPCCGDSHNHFPEFCFLTNSLVFDQTNLDCV